MTDVAGTPSTKRMDAVLDEHRTIRDAIYLVETAPDLPALLQRLHRFRTLLVSHFVNEEAPGGFFDTIREHASRHLPKVAQLGRDHDAFVAQIEEIERRARACLAGPIADTLRAAADLAQRLRDHEAAETQLLLDAIYVDIGEDQ